MKDVAASAAIDRPDGMVAVMWSDTDPRLVLVPEDQRVLDAALPHAMKSQNIPRLVPRAWWERYDRAATEAHGMEWEFQRMPQFRVTWHARLSLEGAVIDEKQMRG